MDERPRRHDSRRRVHAAEHGNGCGQDDRPQAAGRRKRSQAKGAQQHRRERHDVQAAIQDGKTEERPAQQQKALLARNGFPEAVDQQRKRKQRQEIRVALFDVQREGAREHEQRCQVHRHGQGPQADEPAQHQVHADEAKTVVADGVELHHQRQRHHEGEQIDRAHERYLWIGPQHVATAGTRDSRMAGLRRLRSAAPRHRRACGRPSHRRRWRVAARTTASRRPPRAPSTGRRAEARPAEGTESRLPPDLENDATVSSHDAPTLNSAWDLKQSPWKAPIGKTHPIGSGGSAERNGFALGLYLQMLAMREISHGPVRPPAIGHHRRFPAVRVVRDQSKRLSLWLDWTGPERFMSMRSEFLKRFEVVTRKSNSEGECD